MHVIFCRVRDDQRVAPAVRFQCLRRMRGLGRGWSRYDRDPRSGWGGGGLGWTSRRVAPQDDPVIDADTSSHHDQREVLREIEVRRVVQSRTGTEGLLEDGVDD